MVNYQDAVEEELDMAQWVFAPWQAVEAGVEYIKSLEANKDRAVHFPVSMIDTYFAPVIPGQTVAIIAKSQNFKSGFINVWEHHLAKHLAKQGRTHEVIIHVDTEHTLEENSMSEIAQNSVTSVGDLSRGKVDDWGKMMDGAMRINDVQIYRICNRLGKNAGPQLHLSNIWWGIDALVSGKVLGHKVTPAAIFVDYLQALPIDPIVAKGVKNIEKQRRLQVREDVYRMKSMAQHFVCPLFSGVQAKQVLTGTLGPTMLIPGLYDGEETSSIAQRFSRAIGLWMMKNDFSIGDTVSHKGQSFTVEDILLFIRVLKQQGGLPSGAWWDCAIDRLTNTVRCLNGTPAKLYGGR